MTTYCTDIAPLIGANMMLGYQQYIMNQEATTKYYKIEGTTSGGGWTPQSAQQLGSVASGVGKRFNVPDFMQRTLPASPVIEDVTLRISRYPDNTYTNPPELIADRVVTHKFIDSAAMTLLEKNDFDDGTVQGWAYSGGGTNPGSYGSVAVSTAYYLSPLYSLRLWRQGWSNGSNWAQAYKTFTVPSASEAYAIINVLLNKSTASHFYYLRIYEDSDIIAELNPSDYAIPGLKWLRFVVPVTPGGNRQFRIYFYARYPFSTTHAYLYLDDIKIVYS